MKFPIWLFTNEPKIAASADAAGIGGVVVDWEWIGKESRQTGRDTEVNHGTETQLARIRAVVRGRLACRINNLSGTRREEARRAVRTGVDEIWLPMVRGMEEVEEVLAILPHTCGLTVLAETPEAHELAEEFDRWPLERVYFGLNDYAIGTGRPHLFAALVDGALEDFRARYRGPFGFGGVTHPAKGQPIPCREFLAEMARLDCTFGVARRSFRRDVPAPLMGSALADIERAFSELRARQDTQVQSDRESFVTRINASLPALPVGATNGPAK